MKTRLLLLFALIAISYSSFAQAPESFNYQAVIRDVSNNIVSNQAVGIQFKLLQGSPAGTAVYTETHNTTTDTYGLVALAIGTGTTSDNFTIIDWASGPYFLEIAADITGGTSYSVLGTQQLLSTPYALYAKTSGSTAPSDKITDADNNTKIQVEETANEDIIRFDVAGSERMILRDNGNGETMLEFPNSNSFNSNLYLGKDAGLSMSPTGSSGLGNVFIGSDAGELNVSGSANTLIGKSAGATNTASNNTLVGNNSGIGNTTGSANAFFGAASGANSTGSNNVFLGLNSGANATGNNQLYIENTTSSSPLIYGEFDNDLLRVNGTLNINNAFSFPTADGTASQILQTDGSGNVTWQPTPTGPVSTENGVLSTNCVSSVHLDVKFLGANVTSADFNSFWQSVTPLSSGVLVSVEIYIDDGVGGGYSGGTFQIYDGEGISGTLLHTQPVGALGFGIHTFNLTESVIVQSGSKFTFRLKESGNSSFSVSGGGNYPGGIANTPFLNDVQFSTYVETCVNQYIITPSTSNGTVNLAQIDTLFFSNNTYQFTAATDDQTLSLFGNTLSIEDGNNVDLSAYLDDTDTDDQTLSLTGINLTIADGNTIDISSIDTDTDDQTLSLSGNNLIIADGNTVDLSTVAVVNTSVSNSETVGQNASIDITGQLEVTSEFQTYGNVKLGGAGDVTPPTITIGSAGTALSHIIKIVVVQNVGSISSDGMLNVDFSVPGAETGSSVIVSPSADLPNQVFIGQTRVQSSGIVRVRFYNESNSSKDPANMTYYITVIK